MPAPEHLYDRLRQLSVEDPRQAKKLFLSVFETNSSELSALLIRLGKSNEGRLRQVVANALRAHPEKRRILHVLVRWRETETDEFTRRAIEGALADADLATLSEVKAGRGIAAPSELADIYRYVSDRLRHRLRNTMLPMHTQANRLQKLTASDAGSEVQTAVAKLNDAMILMGRELEATDVDRDYFQERSIVLEDWLARLHAKYTSQYSSVSLSLKKADPLDVRVLASDYLLETVFWNLWLNAHQAIGAGCEITIELRVSGADVELVILDNGEGFPRDLKDVVFQQVYSTKTAGRGRGMLEIQDAVERLGGRVELFESKPGDYRIRVRIPAEAQ